MRSGHSAVRSGRPTAWPGQFALRLGGPTVRQNHSTARSKGSAAGQNGQKVPKMAKTTPFGPPTARWPTEVVKNSHPTSRRRAGRLLNRFLAKPPAENSPALQCWGASAHPRSSPGRDGRRMVAVRQHLSSLRDWVLPDAGFPVLKHWAIFKNQPYLVCQLTG